MLFSSVQVTSESSSSRNERQQADYTEPRPASKSEASLSRQQFSFIKHRQTSQKSAQFDLSFDERQSDYICERDA